MSFSVIAITLRLSSLASQIHHGGSTGTEWPGISLPEAIPAPTPVSAA